MRRIFVAYLTGLIAICAGSAGHAFTTDETLQEVQLGANCAIRGNVNLNNKTAMVYIDDGAEFYRAGGFAFFFGGELWASTAITEATIASCLGGIGAEDVTLVDDGANGPDFASDDLIGFGFKLAQDANGFTANTFYSYTVGTGTLTEPDDFVLTDADASLAASMGADAKTIATTVDTSDEAVSFLDFALRDGGGGDGASLKVTALDVNVSGTGQASASKVKWLLDGPDASNVEGTYASGKITFSGLSIEVADGYVGSDESYTIKGYFSDTTGLTDGQTFILSIDGDTDVTTGDGSTTFGSTTPVTNGTGAAIDVTATKLVFTTQPTGSASGAAMTPQPVVTAQDAAGNTDIDFAGTVSLTEASAGSLSGTASVAAVSGVATFGGLTYTATADQQRFALTAASGALTGATSATVTANVVATKLVFVTQPAPTTFRGNEAVTFTTVPVLQAVDDDGVLDTDFTGSVSLGEVDGAGTASLTNGSISAVVGVATFNGLGLTYSNSGSTSETFKIEATSNVLTAAKSAELTARLAPAVASVSSTTADGSYKSGDSISIQVKFSENVTVTGAPKLTLETGDTDQDATYASGSGTDTLTFTYKISDGDTASDLDYKGTDALDLNGGTIKSGTGTDAVLTLATPGQTNSLGAASAIVVDTTAPTVSVTTTATGVQTGKFSVSATFSEEVTNFVFGDITVGNGTASNFSGSGKSYSFDVTPSDDGSVTVDVAAGVAEDAAKNTNTAATQLKMTADITAPSVSLTTDVTSPHSGKFTVNAKFSEDVTGFEAEDVKVNNGSVSNFSGSGATYTFDVTPAADGDVTVDVAAAVAKDAANNDNTAASQLGVTADSTKPTVGLTTTASSPHSGKFSVTATFSEEVTGFALADITVGNGTASNLAGSGKVYTFDVTPSGDGKVTVDVAADVAEDAASNKNSAASQLSVTTDSTAPTITITGPTDVVTDDFTVTVTFSEEVTGFEKGDITVTNGTEGDFTEVTAGTVYTLVVTPDLGSTVSISIAADAAQDAAGNGNTAPDAFTVQAGSPASEFEAKKVEVSNALVEEAQRSTVSMVTSNVRLTQEARGRFIRNLRQSASGFVGDNNVAFGMTADGRAASGGVISTKGKFFQQTGNDEGTYRRVFFGDFDVQSDKESGSTTATLSGKLAWERMTSETTMVGYFIGLDVGRADLDGTFKGDQKSAGLQLGTYVVQELEKNLYLDGFLTVGGAKNQLAMTNGVLDVESDYISKTASVGGAITGVVEQPGYEIWPELAFTVGHTKLGAIDFTGRAYGLVDNSLSLDAGDVTAANLTFRPEVRVPADGRSMEDSRTLVTFAPRAICESVKTTVTQEDCGFGSEFGFTTRSKSGLTNLKARFMFDKVGTSVRRGLQVKLEHRF